MSKTLKKSRVTKNGTTYGQKTAPRWFVYELVEADTGVIRYVGCTSDPWKRLWQHINSPSSSSMCRWIWTMKQRAANVELRIVRWHENKDEARRLEASHIKVMAGMVGPTLLNASFRPRRYGCRKAFGPEQEILSRSVTPRRSPLA